MSPENYSVNIATKLSFFVLPRIPHFCAFDPYVKKPGKFCIFAYFSLKKPSKTAAFCAEFCLHKSVSLKNMLKNEQIFKKCNRQVWKNNCKGKIEANSEKTFILKKHLIGYGIWDMGYGRMGKGRKMIYI